MIEVLVAFFFCGLNFGQTIEKTSNGRVNLLVKYGLRSLKLVEAFVGDIIGCNDGYKIYTYVHLVHVIHTAPVTRIMAMARMQ